jgi:DNA invertase Pin-like site-specific DNA recombinase
LTRGSPLKENRVSNLSAAADIVVMENELLFDSRKFKSMGDMGKLLEDQFLSMLAYVAEQERKKNKQSQKEGIDVAINAGVQFGRPKKEVSTAFMEKYKAWKQTGRDYRNCGIYGAGHE